MVVAVRGTRLTAAAPDTQGFMTATRSLSLRLVATGFALGALAHAAEFLLAPFGLHFRDYPAWRHILFVLLDGGLAALALYRPSRLWIPLLLFLAQQSTTHGRDIWLDWVRARQIAWFGLATMSFVTGSVIVALRHRRSAPSTDSGPVGPMPKGSWPTKVP